MARAGIRDGRWDGPGGAEARFAEAEVSGVDFREARIGLFAAYHSTFEDCDFTGARFAATHFGLTGAGEGQWDGRRWPQTVYRRCDFTRVRFPTGNTFWGNARFEQCLFDRAKLRGMSFTHEAEFVACTFRGKIQDVNFWGRPTDRIEALGRDLNEFTGNDFTGAELVGVAFRHIDLRAQRFPGPPGHAVLDHMSDRVTATLAVVETWPDSPAKQDIQFHLRFGRERALQDNADMALVTDWWIGAEVPPVLRAEVFALLTGYQME